MEANQVNILTLAVLCDLEQVGHTEEARLARQFGSDIGKSNRLDGVDLYGSFLYAVALAYGYARAGLYQLRVCKYKP